MWVLGRNMGKKYGKMLRGQFISCSCTLLQTQPSSTTNSFKKWMPEIVSTAELKNQRPCSADDLKASFIYGTGLPLIFLILPWDCIRDFFTEFQYISVEMKIVSEMAKVTTVKQIPNTAPGRFLRPRKYETNLDLTWKHDNCIRVRIVLLLQMFNCYLKVQISFTRICWIKKQNCYTNYFYKVPVNCNLGSCNLTNMTSEMHEAWNDECIFVSNK